MRVNITSPFQRAFLNLEPDLQAYAWYATNAHANVLIQHGYGECAERYLNENSALVRKLQKAGYNVFAFDMLGHGRSSGRIFNLDIAKSVRAHLSARAIIKNQTYLPVYLFGHSLGGLVSALSYLEEKENISGIILSSPMLMKRDSSIFIPIVGTVAKIFPNFPLRYITDYKLYDVSYRKINYQKRKKISHRIVTARNLYNMLCFRKKIGDSIWDWGIPTLIVHGCDDDLISPEHSKNFFKEIGSRDKQFIAVNGGRHELLNDRCSMAVLEYIFDWLNTRSKK